MSVLISVAGLALSLDVTQQGFFGSCTAGYLKTQVQNCALLLAEHDSLGINLQQKSETLSHIRCHFSISLIRFLLF